MSYHQSNAFSKIVLKFFSLLALPLRFSFPEVSQQFWCCFLSSSSTILKTKEEFLSNLGPFSRRFVILTCCHPLIIVFDCENSFHPSGVIQSIFSLILRSPSSHNYSFHYCSPNLTGASFKCSLVSLSSLRSLIYKFSQASSFIC